MNLDVGLDTHSLGAFNDVITLDGTGYYTGATYGSYADTVTLTLEGNVVAGGISSSVPEPGALAPFSGGVALLFGVALLRRRCPMSGARGV